MMLKGYVGMKLGYLMTKEGYLMFQGGYLMLQEGYLMFQEGYLMTQMQEGNWMMQEGDSMMQKVFKCLIKWTNLMMGGSYLRTQVVVELCRAVCEYMELVNVLQGAEKRQKQIVASLGNFFQNPGFSACFEATWMQKSITSPRTMRKFGKHHAHEPGTSGSSPEGQIVKYRHELRPYTMDTDPVPDKELPSYPFQDTDDNRVFGLENVPFQVEEIAQDELMVHELLGPPEHAEAGPSIGTIDPRLKGKGAADPQPQLTPDVHEPGTSGMSPKGQIVKYRHELRPYTMDTDRVPDKELPSYPLQDTGDNPAFGPENVPFQVEDNAQDELMVHELLGAPEQAEAGPSIGTFDPHLKGKGAADTQPQLTPDYFSSFPEDLAKEMSVQEFPLPGTESIATEEAICSMGFGAGAVMSSSDTELWSNVSNYCMPELGGSLDVWDIWLGGSSGIERWPDADSPFSPF
ncbi:hypothetical protein CDL12_28855 [Handroanthus impetiginosus]|uniref:Uncharacterized protein n=1 Tax=Handroanthus impetiginosus TaxID=429701 RepID=A0A2G9G0J8_9LAMI|nr:hypothetical protein CDL12_28855 [Handroanthus impetiginosus]